MVGSTITNGANFKINPFGKTTITKNLKSQENNKIIVLLPNPQSGHPLRAAHPMLRHCTICPVAVYRCGWANQISM